MANLCDCPEPQGGNINGDIESNSPVGEITDAPSVPRGCLSFETVLGVAYDYRITEASEVRVFEDGTVVQLD